MSHLEKNIFFYGKYNHFAYKYPFKIYNPHKLVWVPKGAINHSMIGRSIYKEPKVKWVHKRKPHFL